MEDYGPDIISITDEDGVEYELEVLSSVTYKGVEYLALTPADAPEDAQRLEKLLHERIPGLPEVQTWYVGPVIGAHCGPGTIAVCFFGRERPQ